MTTATAINVSPEADKEIKRLLSQEQKPTLHRYSRRGKRRWLFGAFLYHEP